MRAPHGGGRHRPGGSFLPDSHTHVWMFARLPLAPGLCSLRAEVAGRVIYDQAIPV